MQLDRSAAYVAAKRALESVNGASWPPELGGPARRFATEMIDAIVKSLAFGETTVARRRCLRHAMISALELATICDVARAHGIANEESISATSRMLSLLGLAYHATSVLDD